MAIDYNIMGERIKKARLEKQLTQENIAEKLDVSVNTVKTQLKSAYSKLRAEFNENDLEIIVLLIFLGYM